MEIFAEGVSAMIAVAFSVSCGLLVEELFFGGLFRLFLKRVKKMPGGATAQERFSKESKQKGEPSC